MSVTSINRVIKDNVLVKRDDPATKTAGGLLIPETTKDRPQQGTTIAVGKGVYNEAGVLIPLDVNVGDKVLFAKGAGQEIKVGDDTLLVLKESDIIAVIG